MINIGLVGLGHLGKIHLKLISEINAFNLVGLYDIDEKLSAELAEKYACKAFSSYQDLLSEVDAVDIVTPTHTHFNYVKSALKSAKHVFVEKPIVQNIEEAKKIVTFTEEANVVLQVGHVERFNPAFLALKDYPIQPKFIEAHRLANFNPRGTDVDVILDLMIHDIDIILKLTKSKVKNISANGVSILSDKLDIANARLEFENKTVANLTASRISMKNMRKMRIFQNDAYISIDFLEKKSEIIELKNEASAHSLAIKVNENLTKYLNISNPKSESNNAIKDELIAFSNSITKNEKIASDVYAAFNSIAVAHKIIEKIEEDLSV